MWKWQNDQIVTVYIVKMVENINYNFGLNDNNKSIQLNGFVLRLSFAACDFSHLLQGNYENESKNANDHAFWAVGFGDDLNFVDERLK